MRKFTLRNPDDTEVVLDQDALVIGYNTGKIDPCWYAKPHDASDWEQVGILLGVGVGVSDSSESSSPSADAGGSASASNYSPAAFLAMVRRQTCYPDLRDMISLFARLSIIGLVVLAGFYVVIGLHNQNYYPVVIGIVVAVLGCFIVVASKQASLLLVDIADTLIEQNRRKRGGTDDSV